MSELRPDIDRKALWVVRELALPTIVRPCVACPSTRHHPTGKFRVNANGKLLDVWLLISCERCDRTSKVPVHERTTVRALPAERLHRFHVNDPALVRRVVLDGGAHRLDWTGTWELETDHVGPDPVAAEVLVRFELPVPVRIERLLMTGLHRSRPVVRALAGSGRIRLPRPVGARIREDFSFLLLRA